MTDTGARANFLQEYANPTRFLTLAEPALPILASITTILFAVGLYLSFNAPEDYQQGSTVMIMFIHVPAAWR
jgi:heme exporter protein C